MHLSSPFLKAVVANLPGYLSFSKKLIPYVMTKNKILSSDLTAVGDLSAETEFLVFYDICKQCTKGFVYKEGGCLSCANNVAIITTMVVNSTASLENGEPVL